MRLLLNIIVLIFEILYYSLFMKYARREGKLSKYILLFSLFSILSLFLSKQFIVNYALIFLLILYGLKYIVKLKTSLFDLLYIIIMFIVKTIIEIPSYYLLTIFINGVFSTILFQITKIIIVYILRNKLLLFYNYLKIKWNNNNFYIRYIFSILMFIYIIFCCIYLILRYFS